MKIAYAFRRNIFYPFVGGHSHTQLPDGDATSRYLRMVSGIGFDGLELGMDSLGGQAATKSQVVALRKRLDDAGTRCVALRAGGGLSQPNVATQNRATLEKAIQVAEWMGAEVVNSAIASPPRNRMPGAGVGAPVSQGSSQLASEDDFVRTARVLREAGQMAGSAGVSITIEVHQNSIADNSWATLHLLELADSPHVYANPDLGNILWNYDEPEETMEEAIVALAPRSKYWHCKNLHRVYVPEVERSYFVRVPLPDGDIDYRFAISAMVDAGYDGYLAIEGATSGDQLYKDQRSLEYVRKILAEQA